MSKTTSANRTSRGTAVQLPATTLGKRKRPLLSPLRYPGGKRGLVLYIERFLALNGLHPTLFVEPFAGGASVSLHVLQHGLAERVILVDRDPLVAGFWKTVFDPEDSEWLAEQVATIPVTLEKWRKFKSRAHVSKPWSHRDCALICLFLNRTSFSGILHPGAGPLGGYEQKSAYPLDCRFPRETLARRIREIAAYADRVTVWCESWRRAFARVAHMQASGTVIGKVCYYCDPPFFEKAEGLYEFSFRQRDHEALQDTLLGLNDDWILSYDMAPGLRQLWDGVGSHRAHIQRLYSMPQRFATEAILSNAELPGLQKDSRRPLAGAVPSDGASAARSVVPGVPVSRGIASAHPESGKPASTDGLPLDPPVIAWAPVKPRRNGSGPALEVPPAC